MLELFSNFNSSEIPESPYSADDFEKALHVAGFPFDDRMARIRDYIVVKVGDYVLSYDGNLSLTAGDGDPETCSISSLSSAELVACLKKLRREMIKHPCRVVSPDGDDELDLMIKKVESLTKELERSRRNEWSFKQRLMELEDASRDGEVTIQEAGRYGRRYSWDYQYPHSTSGRIPHDYQDLPTRHLECAEDLTAITDFVQLKAAPRRIDPKSMEKDEVFVGSHNFVGNFPKGQALKLTVYSELAPSEIRHRISETVKEIKRNPDKTYLFSSIGCGDGNNDVSKMAPYFMEALFVPNVRLQAEFIDEIARKVRKDAVFAGKFNKLQRDALREWQKERAVSQADDRYGDLLRVLPDEIKPEAIRLFAGVEADDFEKGEYLNTVRCCMEGVFKYLVEKKVIAEQDRLSSYGKAMSNCKSAPSHIRTFSYAICSVVNSGSHDVNTKKYVKDGFDPDAFKNYRLAVNDGKYRYLISSLAYMLMNVLEWCSTLETEKGKA